MAASAESIFRTALIIFFSLFVLSLALAALLYRRQHSRRTSWHTSPERLEEENKRRILRMFAPDTRRANASRIRPGITRTGGSRNAGEEDYDEPPNYEAVIGGTDGGELVPRRRWGEMDRRILEWQLQRDRELEAESVFEMEEMGEALSRRASSRTSGDGPPTHSENSLPEPRTTHNYGSSISVVDIDIPDYHDTFIQHLHSADSCSANQRNIRPPLRTLAGPAHAFRRYTSDPVVVRSYRPITISIEDSNIHERVRQLNGVTQLEDRDIVEEDAPPPRYQSTESS